MSPVSKPGENPIPTPTDADAVLVQWHKVAELDDLPDGRVRTVNTGTRSLALTRVG